MSEKILLNQDGTYDLSNLESFINFNNEIVKKLLDEFDKIKYFIRGSSYGYINKLNMNEYGFIFWNIDMCLCYKKGHIRLFTINFYLNKLSPVVNADVSTLKEMNISEEDSNIIDKYIEVIKLTLLAE